MRKISLLDTNHKKHYFKAAQIKEYKFCLTQITLR